MQMGHFLIELAFDQHLREFLYVGGIVSNKKSELKLLIFEESDYLFASYLRRH